MDLNKSIKQLEATLKLYDERVRAARANYHAGVNRILENIRQRKLAEVRGKIKGYGN